MDKNTILVNYMNTINLGQNTLGVQAASLRYFNKQVQDLNLSGAKIIFFMQFPRFRWLHYSIFCGGSKPPPYGDARLVNVGRGLGPAALPSARVTHL